MAIKFVKEAKEMVEKDRHDCTITFGEEELEGECERCPKTGDLRILVNGGNLDDVPRNKLITIKMSDENGSQYHGTIDKDGAFKSGA